MKKLKYCTMIKHYKDLDLSKMFLMALLIIVHLQYYVRTCILALNIRYGSY